MQKRPNNPPPNQPNKAAGSMPKPATPQPPANRPNLTQHKIPPKQMVTAADRAAAKEQRRVNTGFHNPAASAQAANINRPAVGAAMAGAAAGAAAGATLSENLQAQIDQFNRLQDQVMLTPVNDDLEDIATAINALPANIENIRARGYVFKSYLERKVETLNKQWAELRPQVQSAVLSQSNALRIDANQVQAILNRRQLATAPLASLEGKVGAALRNLQGMYDTLDDNVNQAQQQLDDISWTLQQAEMASFGFLATEAPVEAVPANWKKPGDKDGVEGVLFLTDQRLLFEQKEEVATKKVLFIATEKQKVQALQWAVPASQIEKATGSSRGLMGKDDFLTINLVEGGGLVDAEGKSLYDDHGRPLRTTDLHLKGEKGDAWQAFIGRVKSGEIAKERTVPVDTAATETVANAPTKCPNCGGTITQKIMRGQTEVTCEFCGSVIRL